MEFNSFVWALYKSSPAGQEALEKHPADFQKMRSDKLSADERAAEDRVQDETQRWCASKTVNNAVQARQLFETFVDNNEEVFVNIGPVSLAFHSTFPAFFAPYLFTRRFNTFQAICDTFGIPLLPPPKRPQERERSIYYLAINDALQEFRQLQGLTSNELTAFLYDFAPKVLAADIGQELPPPTSVWFAIGGDPDYEFLNTATISDPASWQGNLSARRGDIVLMYRKAPLSHIESAWRIIEDGFSDPFFFYHTTIWIDQCVRFPPIKIKELREHPKLGQNGIVRRDFVGASGSRVPTEDYRAILTLLETKGFDSSQLLVPASYEFEGAAQIEDEEDVEQTLVEPLLKRLGYQQSDWLKQMSLRMGRGERVYPDYALLAKTKHGDESAVILVEAKYHITTQKQLEDAFKQAKSYAWRLQSQAFLLAAMEGVWLFRIADRFSLKALDHFTWKALEDPDQFQKLDLSVGKRNVTKSH